METYPVHVVTAWLGNTASVAAKHYLQTTEEHFDKAVQNPVQQASVSLRNAPLRAPNPTKKPSKTLRTNVFEGDKLPRRDSNDIDSTNQKTGNLKQSESGGHPGGQFGSNSETVASLRQQALTSLQLTWRDIRRMESLSDDPAESIAAGRAMAFVSRAFEELEEGKP